MADPGTVLGAALAIAGLALVLDLTGDVPISVVGVMWALAAMVGAATYFVISADERTGLPPLALAAGGLLVGAVVLGLAGLVEALPMTAGTADVDIGTLSLPWWVPLLLLRVVRGDGLRLRHRRRTSPGRAGDVLRRTVGGVVRVLFAWIALDELPALIQLIGGLLIVAGVVFVRLGEAG